MNAAELQAFLPLNPRVFAILTVLLERPAHGYRIKLEAERHSGGSISLDPGSLYRTIARLVDDGFVAEVPPPADEAEEDARRRYYGLTGMGRALALEEAARLRALLERADRARALAGGADA